MSTDRGAEPSLGGRGSANEMCSGCGAILPCLGPPFAAAATKIIITIASFILLSLPTLEIPSRNLIRKPKFAARPHFCEERAMP